MKFEHFPEQQELRLSLDTQNDWELFAALAEDLVEATRPARGREEGLELLFQRLARWQRLIARDKRGVLSDAEVRGLVGELTFLAEELLPRYGAEAISFWNGPAGAPQDFAIGTICIEVKSRSMTSRNCVSISSVAQLWSPAGNLFLVAYLVAASPVCQNGLTLLDLVSSIRRQLDSSHAADFEDRLADMGFLDLPEYGMQAWDVQRPDVFIVRDGFPRIHRESVPAAISQVKYDLALDYCREFRSEIEWPSR